MVLLAIMLSVGVIGAFGIYTIWGKTSRDVVTIMNLTTESKAVGMDYALLKIKDPVDTVAAYVGARVATADKNLDEAAIKKGLEDEILELCQSSLNGMEGIVGYHIFFVKPFDAMIKRIAFQKGMKDADFYDASDTLNQLDPKDINGTLYWINYTATKRGPVWTSMRKCHYRDGYIFSYMVPIYFNDELVGVAGADVDFNVLAHFVREVSLFGGGYAYLTDEKGKVYYHPLIGYGTLLTEDEEDVPEVDSALGDTSSHGKLITYKYKGQVKKMAFKSLINGMRLVVTANEQDVLRETTVLIWRTVLAAVVIILFFIFLALIMEKRTMHPALDKLDSLAHLDGLTGVWNKTSFLEVQGHLNQTVHNGKAVFGFVMFDLNNLKAINDQYGHKMGDAYLLSAVEMIQDCFPGSQIYRIGGDEFVVVLENEESLRTADQSLELTYSWQRSRKQEKKEPWETPSVAGAFVAFNSQEHQSSEEVLAEADALMYQKKQQMKKQA
ncbi:MAG: diguanylate cyclase [Desulfovibrio sp.]|nr:diguanylate cyclase [Desulfovibrio sp.]